MATAQQFVLTTTPATSTPVAGSFTGTTPNQVTNFFIPQLGRDLYITLQGTWAGTVQLQRSTDSGTTWNNVTNAGGQAWGKYTGNCDEVVEHPTDGASRYRLIVTLTSGTVGYRLAQ